jgi:uncharacterized damage-inducible protein DinB
MTENERHEILASLESGSTALLDALSDVNESSAVLLPAFERWSILQCLEHVTLAERYLFSLIETSTFTDTPLNDEQREMRIITRGADRSFKRESPAYALPRGSFSTLHEALQGFQASRERTIRFVNTNEEDLRSKIAVHPIIGTVNCHEVLLLMAVHPARHAEQIAEIKAATSN